jgi:hypothetical protein
LFCPGFGCDDRYVSMLPNALSKDYAPPKSWMPAKTRAANYRSRRYDDRGSRYYNDWGRRCNDNWCSRRYYDWPIRPTPSIWSAVKAGATSALSTGAIHADE